MQRVFVVCGAGASSTFLVHHMRALATERGLALEVQAGTVADLRSPGADASIVLVAHHLADQFERIAMDAAAAGSTATLMPAVPFDRAGAATAIDTALGTATARTTAQHSAPIPSPTPTPSVPTTYSTEYRGAQS
ncbi:PTS sugar transporter subunit IIB [Marisediminicola senii]|uniref:PTS sugar transporter subunit IIB n=1 Tax=Marisediminicola senii TaxID=2711233 RepID=UPI0013ED83AB|nr:PTS sugar transporter subunit IIABC [Marisediminicola senii]